MIISYLGHSCFKIKGKEASVLTDPFSPSVGFKMPRVSADIVLVSHSHEDHNFVQQVEGNPFVISEPGEYEVKGVEILGIDTFHDSVGGKERGRNIVYHFKCDGISLVHLGDLGCKLTPNQVEDLNGVDILFVPVGGFYTIDLPLVHQIISQLEPKIVIPMHFKTEKHNPEIFGKLNSLDVFLKEMGEEDIRPEKKLKIKSRTQLPEERKIVVLEKHG